MLVYWMPSAVFVLRYFNFLQLVSVVTRLVVLFGHLYFENMALKHEGSLLLSHNLGMFSPMEE